MHEQIWIFGTGLHHRDIHFTTCLNSLLYWQSSERTELHSRHLLWVETLVENTIMHGITHYTKAYFFRSLLEEEFLIKGEDQCIGRPLDKGIVETVHGWNCHFFWLILPCRHHIFWTINNKDPWVHGSKSNSVCVSQQKRVSLGAFQIYN